MSDAALTVPEVDFGAFRSLSATLALAGLIAAICGGLMFRSAAVLVAAGKIATTAELASLLEIPGAREVAVEFNTLSKSHNMAGWRAGAVLGNAEAVRRHVAAHLASFKVPERVEFTDAPLPRNPAGKLFVSTHSHSPS